MKAIHARYALLLFLAFALLNIGPSIVLGQDSGDVKPASSLDAAMQISKATGRPIFAVAGRGT